MTSSDFPATAVWRKSTRSQQTTDQCVELAAVTGLIAIRDSKRPTGRRLTLTQAAFALLADEICQGKHDL